MKRYNMSKEGSVWLNPEELQCHWRIIYTNLYEFIQIWAPYVYGTSKSELNTYLEFATPKCQTMCCSFMSHSETDRRDRISDRESRSLYFEGKKSHWGLQGITNAKFKTIEYGVQTIQNWKYNAMCMWHRKVSLSHF